MYHHRSVLDVKRRVTNNQYNNYIAAVTIIRKNANDTNHISQYIPTDP